MTKKIYLGSNAAVALLGLAGALLATTGSTNMALAAIGLAVAIIPICSHFRMRRTLEALRRLGLGGDALADDRVRSLEDSLSKLNQKFDTSVAYRASGDSGELARYANEIRREARMIRLLTEDLT